MKNEMDRIAEFVWDFTKVIFLFVTFPIWIIPLLIINHYQ